MFFIYHFDKVEPYFTSTTKIFTQAQQGKYEILTSVISLLEALSPSVYTNSPEIINEIDIYFNEAPYLQVVEVTKDISREAAKLRRENRFLRTPDSIQLATALVEHADIFITNDIQIGNLKIPGLKISSLSKDL